MDIRPRLKKIVTMVPICDNVADIGTDHGYALISLIKEDRIKNGIASDNKKKPLEKARKNATAEGVIDSITFRRGNGLETLEPGEVNGVIVAGMGGQLIKDILEASMDIVRSLDFVLLQPAQNPEILREYLYTGPYKVIDEDIIKEDRRFYEYMLIKFDDSERKDGKEVISFRVGDILPQKNHPLIHEFIDYKIRQLGEIVDKIKPTSKYGELRRLDLETKIDELRRIRNVC